LGLGLHPKQGSGYEFERWFISKLSRIVNSGIFGHRLNIILGKLQKIKLAYN
jgi:hypothetical protein